MKNHNIKKCLDLLKKCLFDYQFSVCHKPQNNQPSQIRLTLIGVKSKGPLYYVFIVSINKCYGNYNTTDHPYAHICVRNKLKNMNLKVFNLISTVNEAI